MSSRPAPGDQPPAGGGASAGGGGASSPPAHAPLHLQDPTGRFADRAADYAAARPSYPAAAIDALLAGLGPPATLRIADVGAGTGIAARLLAERRCQVWAVEPNAAMRAAAAPHVRVRWQAGTAEATGLASDAFDLLVCAQAFHWFEPTRALPELRRLLRPGGRLAVMWNERERVQDPATAAYSRLMREASGDHPADRAYDDPTPLLVAAGFVPEPEGAFANVQALGPEGLVQRALSASYVPKEGPVCERLRAGLAALHRDLAGPDGLLHLRYTTRVVAARRPA